MRSVRREVAALAVAVVLVSLTGCTVTGEALPDGGPLAVELDVGPRAEFVDAGPDGVHVGDGDDWTLPQNARPAQNSGFFSEDASLDDLVAVRSIDVSWRQIRPDRDAPIDRQSTGTAQDMTFDALEAQLSEPGDFWISVSPMILGCASCTCLARSRGPSSTMR